MRRTELSAKSILTGLLCSLILWAPLPFASVTPLGRMAVQIAGFLAVVLAVSCVRSTKALRPVAPAALSVVAIGVLALGTSLPWPRWLVSLLSPTHVALADEAAEALGQNMPGWIAPSLAPELSRLTGVSWIAAAALMVSAAVAGRRRSRRRWLVVAFLGAAVVQVLVGLRARLGGIPTIWGQAETADPSRLRGTFVNQNHEAFFLMGATALALGVVWWGFRRAEREISAETKVLLRILPVALWLALLSALTLTGSRAGLMSALVAIVVQFVLMALRKRRWWLLPVGIGSTLSVMVLGGVFAGRSGFERVMGTSVAEVAESYRLEAWSACLDLWSRFPAFGAGFGSFREAFPMVQPEVLVRETWYHAHNDVLELLATGGILALLILMVGLGAVIARLVRLFRHLRRTEDRAFLLGAVGVLAGALVHEFLDFSLTIPANWVVLSTVVGAALGIWIRPDSRQRVVSAQGSRSGSGGVTSPGGEDPRTPRPSG